MILTNGIDCVICGGIEEEYYTYLKWKSIDVIDNVAGEKTDVLLKFEAGGLENGDILFGSDGKDIK